MHRASPPHPGSRPVSGTEQSSVKRAQRVADDQLLPPSCNPMGCAVRIPFLGKEKLEHESPPGLGVRQPGSAG